MKIFFAIALFFFTHCAAYAQWVKTTCPVIDFDGSCACFKGDTLFISSGGYDDYARFHRSTNNGITWTELHMHLPKEKRIQALTYSNNKLVSCMFDWNPDSTSGIFFSTDNGDHWEISEGSGSHFGSITLFAYSNGLLFGIYGSGGLARSTDNGNSWHDISAAFWGNNPITQALFHKNILFLSTYFNGVVRSNDSGNTWTKLDNELKGDVVYDVLNINDTLFANDGDIWKSVDDGLHWSHIFGLNTALLKIATNQKYLFSWGDGVFCSNSNGMSWKNISFNLPTANLSSKNAYLYANDSFVFAFADSMLWRLKISDIPNIVQRQNSSICPLSIYPNPVFGNTINVSLNCILPFSKMRIYDLLGKELISVSITDQNSFRIPIANLSNGSYYVVLNSGGLMSERRFEVLH
ncbi:MAG: T9SS type A sorting domain-containing protein [bacterium]